MSEKIGVILLLLGITLVSGWSDSQGFVHAAQIWHEGQLRWGALGRSALGFACGIILYWGAIRWFQHLGVVAAETQTIVWFGATLMGVALISGRFAQWARLDQGVAVAVLVGIGWLLVRTGA